MLGVHATLSLFLQGYRCLCADRKDVFLSKVEKDVWSSFSTGELTYCEESGRAS